MMNQPIATPVTMSSREIAELCDKNHQHVMRDVKSMLGQLKLDDTGYVQNWTHPQNGQQYPEYRLPKDLTLTLIAGYNVILRKRIIDRWMELETQASGSNVTFLVPKTLPEALRLAADLADTVEEQKAIIATLEPKADFHDAVTKAVNCQTVQEVAKIIGTGQNRLFKWLRDKGILLSDNQPYQWTIDAGYFRVVEGQWSDKRRESHTYTRTLVTGKGLAYIQRKFEVAA